MLGPCTIYSFCKSVLQASIARIHEQHVIEERVEEVKVEEVRQAAIVVKLEAILFECEIISKPVVCLGFSFIILTRDNVCI